RPTGPHRSMPQAASPACSARRQSSSSSMACHWAGSETKPCASMAWRYRLASGEGISGLPAVEGRGVYGQRGPPACLNFPGPPGLGNRTRPHGRRIPGGKESTSMLDKPFAASWRLSGRVGLQEALTLPRIAIESVEPVVEGGRFAAKATVGQPVTFGAVIFTDGHELMAAELLWRHADRSDWHSLPMTLLGNDHWQARLVPGETGRLVFAIEAWWDDYGTYCSELQKKHAAGLRLDLELEEGRRHLHGAINRANGQQAEQLRSLIALLEQTEEQDARVALLPDDQTRQVMADTSERACRLRSIEYPLEVERPLAQFASWYELFPRSVT